MPVPAVRVVDDVQWLVDNATAFAALKREAVSW